MKSIDYDSNFEPKKTKRIIVTPTLPRRRAKEKLSLKQKTVAFNPVLTNNITTTSTMSSPPLFSPVVSPVKLEFPLGSIVSINGRDLDFGRYKSRRDAPSFSGAVENIRLFEKKI